MQRQRPSIPGLPRHDSPSRRSRRSVSTTCSIRPARFPAEAKRPSRASRPPFGASVGSRPVVVRRTGEVIAGYAPAQGRAAARPDRRAGVLVRRLGPDALPSRSPTTARLSFADGRTQEGPRRGGLVAPQPGRDRLISSRMSLTTCPPSRSPRLAACGCSTRPRTPTTGSHDMPRIWIRRIWREVGA